MITIVNLLQFLFIMILIMITIHYELSTTIINQYLIFIHHKIIDTAISRINHQEKLQSLINLSTISDRQ